MRTQNSDYFCARVLDAQYRQLRNSTGCLAPDPNRDSLHNVSEPLLAFDAAAVLNWARLATAGLRAERARIDDLNVFPVADSDTGTNLLLTFVDGATALEKHLAAGEPSPSTSTSSPTSTSPATNTSAGEALAVLARAALRGARGSSGTILSQILLGFASEVATQETIHRADFARALRRASDTAWDAVSTPVPGTILSVVKAAADAATELEGTASAIIARTVSAARTALIETEDQLSILKEAGVVDAGGSGLVVLFEALLATVKGREDLPARSTTHERKEPARVRPELVPITGPSELHEHLHANAHEVDGEFEVMFLVDDDSPTAGNELREALQRIGSSVIVVGGAGLWQVHVHCDDVLAALGVVDRQRRHQVTVHHLPTLVSREQGRDIGLVLCTRAPGLAGELARSGAVVVITHGDEVPSQEQVSRAIVDSGAHQVVIVTARPAAREVARELTPPPGIEVLVMEPVGEAFLLAAAAVHQPLRSADHDPVAAIKDAVTRVRSLGAASRGVGVGNEREDFAQFEKLLRSNLSEGELLTAIITSPELVPSSDEGEGFVAGALSEMSNVSALCEDLEVELEVVYGGQESPPVIWSVE